MAEQLDTKSNVKVDRFRSQLQASYVSCHTEELWYNSLSVNENIYISRQKRKIPLFLLISVFFKSWFDLISVMLLSRLSRFLFKPLILARSLCENTHLCSSLHKLLTPRREFMSGRIEREAGSQGKEQNHNNNFVVRTPRQDRERVILCG